MKILSKREREEIRRECRRRYRTVDQAVGRGEDAAKAYGNWAGPTIEALLDTCESLEKGLAPDGTRLEGEKGGL